jgi:hypothetical protein
MLPSHIAASYGLHVTFLPLPPQRLHLPHRHGSDSRFLPLPLQRRHFLVSCDRHQMTPDATATDASTQKAVTALLR